MESSWENRLRKKLIKDDRKITSNLCVSFSSHCSLSLNHKTKMMRKRVNDLAGDVLHRHCSSGKTGTPFSSSFPFPSAVVQQALRTKALWWLYQNLTEDMLRWTDVLAKGKRIGSFGRSLLKCKNCGWFFFDSLWNTGILGKVWKNTRDSILWTLPQGQERDLGENYAVQEWGGFAVIWNIRIFLQGKFNERQVNSY